MPTDTINFTLTHVNTRGDALPRNAVAVWLKAVFLVASIPPLFGWAPMPMVMLHTPLWQAQAVLWLIIIGCAISLIGIFYPDRLDGGTIEQLGLVVLFVGISLFVTILLRAVPTSWFGAVIYSGLAAAFGIQWWSIYLYRRSLRKAVDGE
jgi:hypothetical protein